MPILTVDELREHISTDLGDPALERLLDAAEELIVQRAGTTGSRDELLGGGSRFITLAKPASSIGSIVESDAINDTTTLVANDYRLYSGDMLIERLATGDHPRSTWDREVTVTYTPVSDDATRAQVQIALCELALNHHPGLTSQQIGQWQETYGSNSVWNNSLERESVLSLLNVSVGMVVI